MAEKTNLKSVNINRIAELSAKPDHSPYLQEQDLYAMIKFANRLMKLGFKAREVIKTPTGYGLQSETETVRIPEFYAVYLVPCSELRMGIRISLYGNNKVVIRGYRSDSVCTPEILEDNSKGTDGNFLYTLHDIKPDRYGNVDHLLSSDGEVCAEVCKDEHEIQVAIGSFKTVYTSEVEHARMLAMGMETAKEVVTKLNNVHYEQLTNVK